METLLADRCEALILLSPHAPAARLAGLAAQLPVVSVARRLRSLPDGVDVVRAADDEGARRAVDHLVALGHRDIVHIDGGRAPGAADRRRGYKSAMKHHGLTDRIRLVPGGTDRGPRGGSRTNTPRRGCPPHRRPPFNDHCAIGVLDTFLRARIPVPDEISVVGFDDSHLARFAHVQLTTVGQEARQLARRAVSRVVARLEGGATDDERGVVVTPHLVLRSTTRSPCHS